MSPGVVGDGVRRCFSAEERRSDLPNGPDAAAAPATPDKGRVETESVREGGLFETVVYVFMTRLWRTRLWRTRLLSYVITSL